MSHQEKAHSAIWYVLCVVLAVVAVPSTAITYADPFGYPDPGYVADSMDHEYCLNYVPSGDQSYAISAMEYLDNRTDLYDQYFASCGAATDAVWISTDLEPGYRGLAPCAVWYNEVWKICDQVWLLYDYAEIYSNTISNGGDGDNYFLNLQKTMRHELGHSVGLSHSATVDDCMRSGWVGTYLQFVSYNDHHTYDHLNSWY